MIKWTSLHAATRGTVALVIALLTMGYCVALSGHAVAKVGCPPNCPTQPTPTDQPPPTTQASTVASTGQPTAPTTPGQSRVSSATVAVPLTPEPTPTPLPTTTPGTTFIIGGDTLSALPGVTQGGSDSTHNSFTGLALTLLLIFGITAAGSIYLLVKLR